MLYGTRKNANNIKYKICSHTHKAVVTYYTNDYMQSTETRKEWKIQMIKYRSSQVNQIH